VLDAGTASRTVASTNMNATSSRAHTVVTITFDQFIKTKNSESKKTSIMNLVDLAGISSHHTDTGRRLVQVLLKSIIPTSGQRIVTKGRIPVLSRLPLAAKNGFVRPSLPLIHASLDPRKLAPQTASRSV